MLSTTRCARLAAAALAIVAFSSQTLFGQAEVVLQNGSILYGEVKSLEFAKLSLDTDDFDLVEIDWDPIVSVKAPGPFVVTLADRTVLTGGLDVDSVNATIMGPNPVTIPRSQIGLIKDFDQGFWNQVSAGVNLGTSFVRGNNEVTSLNFGANAGYETDKTEIDLRYSTILNEQQEGPDTRIYTASASLTRQVTGPLRVGASVGFERDDNQELEYRVPLSGFASFRAVAKQRNRLDFILGAGPTFEKFIGTDGTTVNEGKGGFVFMSRPDGDTSLDISGFVYPSLFDFNRIRTDADLNFRVEIISDLDVNISAYHRFNSEPPADVEKHDYGLTFGLGWSY